MADFRLYVPRRILYLFWKASRGLSLSPRRYVSPSLGGHRAICCLLSLMASTKDCSQAQMAQTGKTQEPHMLSRKTPHLKGGRNMGGGSRGGGTQWHWGRKNKRTIRKKKLRRAWSPNRLDLGVGGCQDAKPLVAVVRSCRTALQPRDLNEKNGPEGEGKLREVTPITAEQKKKSTSWPTQKKGEKGKAGAKVRQTHSRARRAG